MMCEGRQPAFAMYLCMEMLSDQYGAIAGPGCTGCGGSKTRNVLAHERSFTLSSTIQRALQISHRRRRPV
jgi:hypothetical protein